MSLRAPVKMRQAIWFRTVVKKGVKTARFKVSVQERFDATGITIQVDMRCKLSDFTALYGGSVFHLKLGRYDFHIPLIKVNGGDGHINTTEGRDVSDWILHFITPVSLRPKDKITAWITWPVPTRVKNDTELTLYFHGYGVVPDKIGVK